jgi:hypothetical protein
VADLLTPEQRARLEVLTHDLPSKRHLTEAEVRAGVGAILSGITRALADKPTNVIAGWLVELLPRVLDELEGLETELRELGEDLDTRVAEDLAALGEPAVPPESYAARLVTMVREDPAFAQLEPGTVVAFTLLAALAGRAILDKTARVAAGLAPPGDARG